VRSSEVARHAQAQVVNDFVDDIVEADPGANVIVLGDINDFDFSETVQILEGDVLSSLMHRLAPAERYSYVFEGNSQVLDQILVSDNMLASFAIDYDPVHVNSEFADQASDHDPQVARLNLRGRPSPKS
jgi:predicted extracellular nuclease